jgi:uncharacterized OB-fold protein
MSGHEDWSSGNARLLAQKCLANHLWYLPRARCPFCGGEVTTFEPSGLGTIFSQTSLHRLPVGSDQKEAIGIALVDLDDGVRMMARCVPGTPIGTRVVVSIATDPSTSQLLPLCEVLSA